MDSYAGLRGQDAGLAVVAVFEILRDALVAAQCERTGPDGPNDPRGRDTVHLSVEFEPVPVVDVVALFEGFELLVQVLFADHNVPGGCQV